MGDRPVSKDLEQRAATYGIEFEHLGLTLGTVLHNVDLTVTLTAELTQVIRDALLERKVIFFRDQHLSEDQQTSFGRQFGGLDAFPFGTPGDNPFILKISHGPGSPGTENGWHTDVTWMEQTLTRIDCAVRCHSALRRRHTLFRQSRCLPRPAYCIARADRPPEWDQRLSNLHTGSRSRRYARRSRHRGEGTHSIRGNTSARAHPSRNRQAGALSPRRVPPPRVAVRPAYRPDARARTTRSKSSPPCSLSTDDPSTSVAFPGRLIRLPSGTTGPCSTTRPATTTHTSEYYAESPSAGTVPTTTSTELPRDSGPGDRSLTSGQNQTSLVQPCDGS